MTTRTTSCKLLVAVDGATGYIGAHLVKYLLSNHQSTRCLIHSGAKAADVAYLRAQGAEICTVDFSVDQACDALIGVDTLVHLIGSIAPRRGENLNELHVEQTKHLVSKAKQAGVRKIIMISAIGAASDAPSDYHSTKFLAEEVIRNSGFAQVILRTSLVVGNQGGLRDSKLVARYRNLILNKKKVPILNEGKNHLQPLFIGDLVEIVRKVIDEDVFDGKTYELGGGEILSLREFVSSLMECLQKRRPLVNVPDKIAVAAATACEWIQPVPLISRDQIKIAKIDSVCKVNAVDTVFGVKPRDVRGSLNSYQEAL